MTADASVSLTAALATVWAAIRRHHPDVPEVVLLPAPNPHGRRGVLGHFAALRWSHRSDRSGQRIHEVVVVAEHLDRSAEDVVGTLLHEAAHALNFERRIHDCSRSQYHNRAFRAAAEEVGLQLFQVPHYGFSKTEMLPATATRYAPETAALSLALMHRRDNVSVASDSDVAGDPTSNGSDEEQERRGRYKKASCKCPYNIRVARSTMAATVIRCETCNKAFSFS